MIEIPEAFVISKQINEKLIGKKIINVVSNHSPHKFAWFYKDPKEYYNLLVNKYLDSAKAYGGLIEISFEDVNLVLGDGVNIRYQSNDEKLPSKHQLLIQFDDNSYLFGSIQMYGGLWAFPKGNFDYPYYKVALEKPSPLIDDFNYSYFTNLIEKSKSTVSVKAFLATEQCIPGLGNGVLQDILYDARIHPKRKLDTLSLDDKERLYSSIKEVLKEIALKGGRDTEKDLFGNLGNYETKVSKNTVGTLCKVCGSIIKKDNYLGGSIYYCENCQK